MSLKARREALLAAATTAATGLTDRAQTARDLAAATLEAQGGVQGLKETASAAVADLAAQTRDLVEDHRPESARAATQEAVRGAGRLAQRLAARAAAVEQHLEVVTVALDAALASLETKADHKLTGAEQKLDALCSDLARNFKLGALLEKKDAAKASGDRATYLGACREILATVEPGDLPSQYKASLASVVARLKVDAE
jgi:hypothetical protein